MKWLDSPRAAMPTRTLQTLGCLCIGLLTYSVAAAGEFPYTATVAHLNVTARSGPTYGTYATERLSKHSQVEVYQAEGDWLAIRPPDEAFDWVPASAVKRTDDPHVAEVTVDDTSAWIGSNIKKVENHVSQVQLKRGEQVRILAEKPLKHADGSSETWFKIAPPAGEFRWVQAKHLSTRSPAELAREEKAERLARDERWRKENAESPPGLLAKVMQGEQDLLTDRRDGDVQPAQFFGRGRAPLLSRNPRSTRSATKAEDPGIEGLEIDNGKPSDRLPTSSKSKNVPDKRDSLPFHDTKGSEDAQPQTGLKAAEEQPPVVEKSSPKKPAPTTGSHFRPTDSAEFKRLLTQLEVDLTVAVAGDSSKWNLKPLRERAEALVEDGATALERGQARLVLDRIAEFEATLPPGQAEGLASASSAPRSEGAPAEKAKPEFETRYDAVGYLMPVIAIRPGLPPYQLTDKDGKTIQYVSPAPGVNLNRYVKKQVGLYGQRGYLETLKKQHLMAERVVDLDRHRR